ncbi:MAG TPA: hypothetical protein VK664_19030 [Flavitalea sp.]|nr:hypothetical protein [Flavitalea sp.]
MTTEKALLLQHHCNVRQPRRKDQGVRGKQAPVATVGNMTNSPASLKNKTLPQSLRQRLPDLWNNV